MKWIFFDCMETIIDLTKLPTLEDYAHWSFDNCPHAYLWSDFSEYFEMYKIARQQIIDSLPIGKEYNITRRFDIIAEMKLATDSNMKKDVSKSLTDTFKRTYFSKCYVESEIVEVLTQLKKQFKLGVVSNFLIENGITHLLKENKVYDFFNFVINSVHVGYKKPHTKIYEAAIEKANCSYNDVIFIGDDIDNDYHAPISLGMSSILYDRENRYVDIKKRVTRLNQIIPLINKK